MRRLTILFLLPVAAVCSARPGWVHTLPQSRGLAAGSPQRIEAGIWERNARNRHPVIHRTHYTDSRETIETFEDQTYCKIHLYAVVTDGNEKMVAYRERGKMIPGTGSWVLFQPETAERFETESAVKHPYRGPDTRYPFPGVDTIAFMPVSVPDPLLYLHDQASGRMLLLPASYEWLGRVYNFGVYEGSTDAFDSSSVKFERAKKIYLERKFQESHYALRLKSE